MGGAWYTAGKVFFQRQQPAAHQYHSTFENGRGEQNVFLYNFETEIASLWAESVGLDKAHTVIDGRVEGLDLTPEENMWLKACWQAILIQQQDKQH